MSDDIGDGGTAANEGVTLPNEKVATYNISLSPLFMGRSGRASWADIELTVQYRGDYAFYRASTARGTNAYYLQFDSEITHPSNATLRSTPHSLRCLVSTNNT